MLMIQGPDDSFQWMSQQCPNLMVVRLVGCLVGWLELSGAEWIHLLGWIVNLNSHCVLAQCNFSFHPQTKLKLKNCCFDTANDVRCTQQMCIMWSLRNFRLRKCEWSRTKNKTACLFFSLFYYAWPMIISKCRYGKGKKAIWIWLLGCALYKWLLPYSTFFHCWHPGTFLGGKMPQKSNIEHFWTDEERQWHLRFLVSFLWSTRLKEPTSDFQPDPIFEKEPCTPFPFLKMTADMRHSAIPWPIISAWNQLHAEICYSEAARITTITEKWNVGDFLSEPVGCQKSSGQLTCMLTCCKKSL